MRAVTLSELAMRVRTALLLAAALAPAPARAEGPAADPGAPAVAAALVRRGLERYRAGDHGAAAADLRRAHAVGGDWRLLYPLAHCCSKARDPACALAALEAYLRQGGSRVLGAQRERAERELEQLRARVARLRIVTNVPGAEVTLDGEPAGRSPVVKVVAAGERRIVATHPGFERAEATIVVAGMGDAVVSVELERTPTPAERRHRVTLWVVWATTGGLAASTAGLAVATASGNAALTELRASPSVSEASVEAAEARNLALSVATGVLAGLAVMSLGAGLYFTLWGEGDDEPTAPPAAGVAIGTLGAGPAGVTLTAMF
jgi:hypothetical protein